MNFSQISFLISLVLTEMTRTGCPCIQLFILSSLPQLSGKINTEFHLFLGVIFSVEHPTINPQLNIANSALHNCII